MNSSRIALVAAVSAAVCWTLKAIAIGTAGGLDKSAFESPLFFAGLVSAVVAAVALGVALTGGRPLWVRILAGAAGPVLTVGVAAVLDVLVAAIQPESASPHWVWSEVGLWVMAAGAVALALAVRGRGTMSRLSVS